MDISIRDMNICPRIPLPRRVPDRTCAGRGSSGRCENGMYGCVPSLRLNEWRSYIVEGRCGPNLRLGSLS